MRLGLQTHECSGSSIFSRYLVKACALFHMTEWAVCRCSIKSLDLV